MKDFHIRFAQEEDVPLILNFIRQLATYEKLLEDVVASEELLHANLFEKKYAEVIIGESRGEPVAFAIFFHNFSTFLGKPGLYLEDLFVKPEMRGVGFGKAMLIFLAKLALERDCGRFEWAVLDWNEPAIRFYRNLGAVAMDEWGVYRLTGKSLRNLAGVEDCPLLSD